MSCQEKARLAEDYRAATAAFAEAVRDFQQRMESTSTEYDLLRRISDEARLAFEQHMAAHHCGCDPRYQHGSAVVNPDDPSFAAAVRVAKRALAERIADRCRNERRSAVAPTIAPQPAAAIPDPIKSKREDPHDGL